MTSPPPPTVRIPDEEMEVIYRMTMSDPVILSALQIKFNMIQAEDTGITVDADDESAENGDEEDENEEARPPPKMVPMRKDEADSNEEKDGKKKLRPGTLLQKSFDQHWKRKFLFEVFVYYFMFTVCPVRVRDEEYYSGDDDNFKKTFKRRKTFYSKVKVPFIVDFGTFHLDMVFTNGKYEPVFSSKDPLDKKPYLTLKSDRFRGPDVFLKSFVSEASSLVGAWERLILLQNQNVIACNAMANPPIYMEHITNTTYEELKKHHRSADEHESDEVERDAVGDPVKPGDKKIKGSLRMHDVYLMNKSGTIVDPVENLRFLPKFYKFVPKVGDPKPPPDMIEVFRQYQDLVATRMGIPHHFFHEISIRNQTNTAASVQSDNSRFAVASQRARDDLVAALEKAWRFVWGHETVKVVIPVATHLDWEQVKDAFLFGALSEDAVRMLTTQIMGVHENHTRNARFPLGGLIPETATGSQRRI